jgi:adenylosuccinate lyase
VIERYTRKAMGEIWSLENRFRRMLDVEVAVALVQAELGLIPKPAAREIEMRGKFDVQRILEIEKTTKHDVIAFVSNVAENVGENGRYVHFGLTSSDVLDTALSLITRDAGELFLKSADKLIAALDAKIREEKDTLCAGRTHGMHAEPTTFGMKLAGHWAEVKRSRERVSRALAQMKIGKLSGAVGTYSTQSEEVEAQVCKRLGLTAETVATQVIPRDRHAEMITALAIFGGALERLAVELRHLQRTEVGEVVEGFTPGQKGSSAMPHKKNPISAENITGAARMLRGYASASLEDIALWHERDISHSSVERVIFPDAFILADYACDRMAELVSGLYVDRERMRKNMDVSGGQLMSSHLLLALVDSGLSREDAYSIVQKLSHALKPGETLQSAAFADADVSKRVGADTLKRVFSGERHLAAIRKNLTRLGF